ncbi:dTDP-4-dehydrorhamnose 3,5-epimerase family protein [Candidatus Omnitrophota bacterium]
MKILEIKALAIPEIKVIRFARFPDERGYFTEQYRKSDFADLDTGSLRKAEFLQCNESFSKAATVRGLHFQWDPRMGKLVRTLSGRMVDLALDIRKGSPAFGKIVAHEMPAGAKDAHGEWIWVPPGFAHGNFFTEDTLIEYMCTGEYSPKCEAGISPLSADIDWTLCEPGLKKAFDDMIRRTTLITEKDRGGFSLESWKKKKDSDNFLYDELKRLCPDD